MLLGNLTSIVVGAVVVLAGSLIRPDRQFNFNQMRNKLCSKIIPTEEEHQQMKRQFSYSCIASIVVAVVLLIIFPFALYFSSYVFSSGFFTGWVSIVIAWMFISSFMVVLFPLWEGRKGLKRNFGGLARDMRHCDWKPKEHEASDVDPVFPAETLSGKQLHTIDREEDAGEAFCSN